MKTSAGKCRIDGVMIGEVSSVMIGPNPYPLTVKYALVHSASGATCGSGSMRDWSPSTVDKFKELLECMEEDILRVMFEVSEGAPVSSPEPVSKEDVIPEL